MDLGSNLRHAASAAQSLQDRLSFPGLRTPVSTSGSQATTALSALSQKVQEASSVFVPQLDVSTLTHQAQEAVSKLVPDFPTSSDPYSDFGRDLPPHFGTQAAARALQQVGGWASQQLLSLEMTNPQARVLVKALSSQVNGASKFLQQNIIHPVQEIPQILGQVVGSGSALLHDSSSSALSTGLPAAAAAWLESLTAAVQQQSESFC